MGRIEKKGAVTYRGASCHCDAEQFSTAVVRAWRMVCVRKWLPALATVAVAEGRKWSRAVVLPSDSVVSENSAVTSLLDSLLFHL